MAGAGVRPSPRGTVPSFISVNRLSRLGDEKSLRVPFLAITLNVPVFGLFTRPNTELRPPSGTPHTAEIVPAGSEIVSSDGDANILTAGRVLLLMKTAGE